jgi:hypothetical protein
LNERGCILLSLLLGEVATSMVIYIAFPRLALVATFPSNLSYLAGHFVPAAILWLVVGLGCWFLLSPTTWWHRRSDASKLQAITKACLVGAAVNVGATLYLWFASPGHAAHNRPLAELGTGG